MKTTGVVRRIDDLGRIVIPKEIRKTMKIREGDSLEIVVDEHGFISLKKFSPLGDIEKIATSLIDALQNMTENNIIICDMEQIISTTKQMKKLLGKRISSQLEELLEKKEDISISESSYLSIAEGVMFDDEIYIKPLLVYGDIKGGIIFIGKISLDDKEIIEMIEKFLENYLLE